MEKKMTKKEMFEMIKGIVAGAEIDEATQAEVTEFVEKQIAQLEAKAEKAKERAAQKKTEGDALRDAVEAVLTGELQTIDEITAQVAGEDVTKAKVTARLTQLVKAEIATKDMVKAGSRKVTAYRLV